MNKFITVTNPTLRRLSAAFLALAAVTAIEAATIGYGERHPLSDRDGLRSSRLRRGNVSFRKRHTACQVALRTYVKDRVEHHAHGNLAQLQR